MSDYTYAEVIAFYNTHGCLPDVPDVIKIASSDGVTIAHLMAEAGILPEDFKDWDLADKTGWTVAHNQLFHRRALPDDFDAWDMTNNVGLSVAHIGANFNLLPADFVKWDIADETGITVAHTYATLRELPKSFNKWYLADRNGISVAHRAAKSNTLPENFKDWDLRDNQGNTVFSIYKAMHIPEDIKYH